MKNFKDIANNLNQHLDELTEKLKNSKAIAKEELKNINGIYAFYENDKPIYVGRTNRNRMRKRIQEHSMKSSNQNSATFAFRMAKEMKNDNSLSKIETYDPDFVKAKERVSKMQIKFVEIDDPIIQTILEPYVAYKLGTLNQYNDFVTH